MNSRPTISVMDSRCSRPGGAVAGTGSSPLIQKRMVCATLYKSVQGPTGTDGEAASSSGAAKGDAAAAASDSMWS